MTEIVSTRVPEDISRDLKEIEKERKQTVLQQLVHVLAPHLSVLNVVSAPFNIFARQNKRQ
jgi:hypothetical protein